MTPQPLRLVIWDCDGVLVDSEGPSARVTSAECTRLGWPMTDAEALRLFAGVRLFDIPPMVEAQTSRPVPLGWVEHVRDRLIETLGTDLDPMPGVAEALRATAALGLPYRVASNSSHEEMAAKFARTGLTSLVEGRIHSARDVPRGKPSPDVFLAAAAAEGVPAAACIVIEDSIPGVTAAVAAGMAVLGLDPHGDGAALRAAGARPICSLAELPAIFRAAMRRAA